MVRRFDMNPVSADLEGKRIAGIGGRAEQHQHGKR
jgi:hypothetical protein